MDFKIVTEKIVNYHDEENDSCGFLTLENTGEVIVKNESFREYIRKFSSIEMGDLRWSFLLLNLPNQIHPVLLFMDGDEYSCNQAKQAIKIVIEEVFLTSKPNKIMDLLAEYVSATPERSEKYLVSQGVDVDKVVVEGMDRIRKLRNSMEMKRRLNKLKKEIDAEVDNARDIVFAFLGQKGWEFKGNSKNGIWANWLPPEELGFEEGEELSVPLANHVDAAYLNAMSDVVKFLNQLYELE